MTTLMRVPESTVSRLPGNLVDIQILGDSRDISRRLAGLDLAFASENIAAWLVAGVDPLLRQKTEQVFASEGEALGQKWQDLTPFTVQDRKNHGFPGEHPINVRTGQMKKHLIDAPPRIAIHSLGATMWSPGNNPSGKLGKKIQTAQQGDPSVHTPARPVLGVDTTDLEIVLLALSVHIASKQPGGVSLNGNPL